jgi:hypothetical protein
VYSFASAAAIRAFCARSSAKQHSTNCSVSANERRSGASFSPSGALSSAATAAVSASERPPSRKSSAACACAREQRRPDAAERAPGVLQAHGPDREEGRRRGGQEGARERAQVERRPPARGLVEQRGDEDVDGSGEDLREVERARFSQRALRFASAGASAR